MSSEATRVKDLIKTRGYWEVDMHSLEAKTNRFESMTDCMNKVRDSVVELRGWPYPVFSVSGVPYPMQERIEAVIDSHDLKEYWTMFFTGHFYHIFAFREDWLKAAEYGESPSQKFLEFMITLYSVTEIYEFAIRLAQKNVFGSGVQIKIYLHGMEGRKLTTLEPFRVPFFHDYVCREKDLSFVKRVSVEELIAEGNNMALDTVFKIFDTFGWLNMPKERLREDQRKFLEKRI
jgi:hypothetical protein